MSANRKKVLDKVIRFQETSSFCILNLMITANLPLTLDEPILTKPLLKV